MSRSSLKEASSLLSQALIKPVSEGKKLSWRLLLPLFILITLLNVVFTALRCLRSTLAVADVDGSALSVPFYDLVGTLPIALLIGSALSKMLRKKDLKTTFNYSIALFILFFLLFAFFIYPLFLSYHSSHQQHTFIKLPILLFFAIAEMWKVVLLTVLLFGLLNGCVAQRSAQLFYAPLMLGNSAGALLVAPCNEMAEYLLSPVLSFICKTNWHSAMAAQLILLSVLALSCAFLFSFMYDKLYVGLKDKKKKKPPKLFEAISTTWHSPALFGIAMIVISDYVIYTLFEVLFLDLLKRHYSDPVEFCSYMATLSQWGGALTAVSALTFAPWLLTQCSWRCSALMTPLSVLFFVFFFFAAQLFYNEQTALLFGSLLFITGRATKYTLLDTAKELAFLPLDTHSQRCGKLAIDTVASRFGRALASLLVLFIGINYAAAALFLLFFSGLWIKSTAETANVLEGQLTG